MQVALASGSVGILDAPQGDIQALKIGYSPGISTPWKIADENNAKAQIRACTPSLS